MFFLKGEILYILLIINYALIKVIHKAADQVDVCVCFFNRATYLKLNLGSVVDLVKRHAVFWSSQVSHIQYLLR